MASDVYSGRIISCRQEVGCLVIGRGKRRLCGLVLWPVKLCVMQTVGRRKGILLAKLRVAPECDRNPGRMGLDN